MGAVRRATISIKRRPHLLWRIAEGIPDLTLCFVGMFLAGLKSR
jgi:hypothetical protein